MTVFFTIEKIFKISNLLVYTAVLSNKLSSIHFIIYNAKCNYHDQKYHLTLIICV